MEIYITPGKKALQDLLAVQDLVALHLLDLMALHLQGE